MRENSSSNINVHPLWYAIYAQVRHEERVYERLLEKSFHCFFPRIERWSRRRDRRKRIQVPLFPGYLFVNSVLDNYSHLDILKTRGVVRVLGNANGPIPIPRNQIESLMILLDHQSTFAPCQYLKEGDLVKVVHGPLKGCEGILIRADHRRGRLVVAIDIIRQAVSVELDIQDVEPITW